MKLLNNGKDSLKKSIKALNDLEKNKFDFDYEYKLKDIVINLHHSIETIFKYMIKEKNEFLVYSNCEDIFKNQAQGKFKSTKTNTEVKTIQFLDAVHRVIVLYNVNLKKEDYNKFAMLNEIRNSLTHYEREFADNEIEHLVALMLPVLLKILKENIKSFDNWAKVDGIYSNVNSITKNVELWSVEYYYIFQEKWAKGKLVVENLDKNPKEKGEIFSQKNNKIEYMECPLCHNQLFHATGTYIVNADEILYLGECEYCKINVNKRDAQFIALNYDEFKNYDICGVNKMKDVLIKVLLSEDIDIDRSNIKNNIISTIISNTDVLIDGLKILIGYKVDDICTRAAEYYFQSNLYPYNDVMEDIIENVKSEVYLELIEVVDYIISDEVCIKGIRNLSNIIDEVSRRDEEFGDILKKYIDKIYMSYHQGMYLNYDGEDVESEITIEIKFDYEYIINSLESKEDNSIEDEDN